jgi:branched-chain amino acid transport system permease protein
MTQTELFIQLLINGFTLGSYLALIALGYTMVYGIIELINFAHGDLYMLNDLFPFLGIWSERPLEGWQLWAVIWA